MKEQLISYLSGLGYQCEVDNGVLMILVDVADRDVFAKIRKIVHEHDFQEKFWNKTDEERLN